MISVPNNVLCNVNYLDCLDGTYQITKSASLSTLKACNAMIVLLNISALVQFHNEQANNIGF